ncbi:AcrR family transcriptional regulator [Clostridium saccharoperbutylacetonicum]|uniref:Transcriptional regulator, TetR family n=1 Tax=Clostridium saccharoperbutylacetonicum N1-4(HMT) TaxID=931276 RepID=M1MGW4_9CLOT|nr:TetR/AcrR family transcriptional regulator [Clostridium saccharoperbutylacetonicum]AGF55583.1 transcriptional regulator, TetR family [Clostridium saccharoperbutylacetonicum N1-4(HMT)]NRT63696.1 AcrR family transcriptional regulator [Clostridium saccharoperbutylacetonicum]NSB27059.1 AcrR family transcriptional regulator [Clostridium saccharoperbutylacetonicum]NSB40544.1 AcrR family transcriptional regulator [Clostridium saccharoperbutylacetonicum]
MKKDMSNLNTKDKILEATLNIISEEGFQNVTIRKIAVVADVNVAAVNYHFGSKDNVINEALEYLMIQSKNIFKCLKNTNEAPELRLRTFIDKYTKNLIKYPDQIKNLIHQSIYENSTKNKFQEYLEMEGVELIKATIQQIRPDKDDVTLQILVTQLLSCLLFPVLLGDRATEIFGIKLNDPKKRNAYIELLIKNVIQ